jgi:hypothetical protein
MHPPGSISFELGTPSGIRSRTRGGSERTFLACKSWVCWGYLIIENRHVETCKRHNLPQSNLTCSFGKRMPFR